MDIKRTSEPDRLVSAYLQRPIRTYEEALKARESATPPKVSQQRIEPKRKLESE